MEIVYFLNIPQFTTIKGDHHLIDILLKDIPETSLPYFNLYSMTGIFLRDTNDLLILSSRMVSAFSILFNICFIKENIFEFSFDVHVGLVYKML